MISGLGRSPGRERLLTPPFWHKEFHKLYSPWGRKESDTTEGLSLSITLPTVPPSILHQTARETIFKKYKSESVVL